MNTLYWITTLDSIFIALVLLSIVSGFAIIIFSCFFIVVGGCYINALGTPRYGN